MRSEMSSLAYNDASLLRFFAGKRSSARRRLSPPRAAAAGGRRRGPSPPWSVVPPSPPWSVVPPSPPPESARPSAKPWPPELPPSFRMEQMKRRIAAAPPPWPPSADDPAGKAAAALLSMIGDLQRCVLPDESVLDRASRDRRDSFVWLFRRVFFSSPNLLVSLLVLLADFVVFSAEINAPEKVSPGEGLGEDCNLLLRDRILREFLNWFDLGIKEGSLDPRQREEESSADRRRRAYERAIAGGEASSLILGNYAQFLYAVANDHDRAELYFQWAAMAEPRDAEAVSRYAFFLWEGRGDISGAEQMFLEAIEIEPGNHYFSSNYAWFLWKTGALDTCYPINPPDW
ncbi:uncharacterized protein LOC144710348 [Wolffia australiana]